MLLRFPKDRCGIDAYELFKRPGSLISTLGYREQISVIAHILKAIERQSASAADAARRDKIVALLRQEPAR
nr:hypothetical protein SHINE37_90088 [Rhizobiaceae bacterium]